jgi:predicted DNA-binding ribbon-helix-helix protein
MYASTYTLKPFLAQKILAEKKMRTTVNIEEDVFLAVKEIAKKRGMTMGKVLSELARMSLTRKASLAERDGLPLFPIQPKAEIVTLERVNQLRDE